MVSQHDAIARAPKREPRKPREKANVWRVCGKHRRYILIYGVGCVNVSWFQLGICTRSHYPPPSENTVQTAGLAYICLDYLRKGCGDLLSLRLQRAAASRHSSPLGSGCPSAGGSLEAALTDAKKLVCFPEA